MIKKKLHGETLKEQLKASAKDRLHSFLLADGTVRGAFIHSTRMVNEMRASFDLGILETLTLGHAYMGCGLLTASLKGNDRIALGIQCSGPIKGLSVEANAFGEVRGCLKNVPIPIDKPLEDFNLSPFFGAGFLTITKYLEDAKQPYTGKIPLEYGNIAQDLSNYFLSSEQTPTSFNLSIKFDGEGNVIGAGGLFLQAMPGASDETVASLDAIITSFPSPGEIASGDQNPEEVIKTVFAQLSPKILSNHRVEFFCRCTEKGIASYLAMLPEHDLKDIKENGPFPIMVNCHNCNTSYSFSEEAIKELYQNRSK